VDDATVAVVRGLRVYAGVGNTLRDFDRTALQEIAGSKIRAGALDSAGYNPDKMTLQAWSRSDKLAVTGILFAILIGIGAYFGPEVRRAIRLDKPTNAAVTAPPVLTAITAKNLNELRRQNRVECIKATEAEKTLAEIPAGSYGFAYGSYLVLRYTADEIKLKPGNRAGPFDIFEVHKLHDGARLAVFYVGPETIDRLRSGVPVGEKLTLYSDAWQGAPNLVALPLSGIKCSRDREVNPTDDIRDQRHALDCEAK